MQIAPQPPDIEPASTPLACNLNAIDAQNRPRHEQLARQLFLAPDRDLHELPNGYAFRFAGNRQVIMNLAEFITYEALCCPFITFTLELEPNGNPVWLTLTGSDAVK